MKRPDLEMLRVINKRSKFVDLDDALNLPFFYLSHKNISDFELATGEDHRESRVLKTYDDGAQRKRHYVDVGGLEWVYDKFVLSARDNVLLDYSYGTMLPGNEKIVKYWGTIEPTEDADYVYFAFQYSGEKTFYEWEGCFEVSERKDDLHQEVTLTSRPRESKRYEDLMRATVDLYREMGVTKSDYDGYMKGIRAHVTAFYGFACRLMTHLKYSDKHAVEVTPTKLPKVSQALRRNRPWAGATGPRVLLLDRMPTTQGQGTGTHASPKPHRRRGHWKTLSHPRFRHHPQYEDKIYVKPSFVGPRQVSYEGNIYRLVEPTIGGEL